MRKFTVWSVVATLAIFSTGIVLAADTPAQTPAQTPAPSTTKSTKHDPVQRILAKFDKNNDGCLQPDELAAFVAAHEKHMAESGKTKEGAATDGVTKEAAPKPTAEDLMKKYDTNGDGKLDATELHAMFKELHAHHHAGHKKQATT